MDENGPRGVLPGGDTIITGRYVLGRQNPRHLIVGTCFV